jgi:hypothetical protein
MYYRAIRTIRLTPTIIAMRYENGAIEVTEFQAPRDSRGVYGYEYARSFRMVNGERKLFISKDAY